MGSYVKKGRGTWVSSGMGVDIEEKVRVEGIKISKREERCR